MSGKTEKAQRKEDEAVKQEYLLRKDGMFKEVQKLSEQFRIDIVPVLKYTDQGVIPYLAFVDVKHQYEAMTDEAKQTVKNGISNHKAKTTVHLET